MRKVVAAGSILVDKINEIGTYPKAGELAQIRARTRVPGGLVPNTGCDVHILDPRIPVSAFGAVGDDEDGRFVKDEMARRGIDVSGVVTVGADATSFTDVMSVVGGERTFFTYPGAGDAFCAGCLVGIFNGLSERGILETAALAAVGALSAPGATEGMRPFADLKKLVSTFNT